MAIENMFMPEFNSQNPPEFKVFIPPTQIEK